MSDKPQAIKVEALKWHTYNGKAYDVGDTYDFYPSTEPSGLSADDQVASLQTTGFAARVDRAKVAKEQAKAAEASVKAQAKAAEKPAKAPKARTARPTKPSKKR
jgi:hypothetical protein